MHTFIQRLGLLISWLALAMVCVSILLVLVRYLKLGHNLIALQQSVIYMHATLLMLFAAPCLGMDGHVRVDLFYRQFSQRQQAWINALGTTVLLFPFMAFIVWVSLPFALSSWEVLEASEDAGGIPAVFILKSLIPISALLLLLQGLLLWARAVCIIIQPATDPAKPKNTTGGLSL